MDDIMLAVEAMTDDAPQDVSVVELDERVQKMLDFKQRIDVLDEAKKNLNEEYTKLKTETLRMLESLGRLTYQVPGVGTATKITELSYKMPSDVSDKKVLFDYIADKFGLEALLGQLSIHHQTLNSFAKSEVNSGISQVPGLGSPTTNEYLRFTQARKKA